LVQAIQVPVPLWFDSTVGTGTGYGTLFRHLFVFLCVFIRFVDPDLGSGGRGNKMCFLIKLGVDPDPHWIWIKWLFDPDPD
jgi:hypothetical protein